MASLLKTPHRSLDRLNRPVTLMCLYGHRQEFNCSPPSPLHCPQCDRIYEKWKYTEIKRL